MQLAKGNARWASEGLDFRQKGIYAAGYRDSPGADAGKKRVRDMMKCNMLPDTNISSRHMVALELNTSTETTHMQA